ncbi:lipoprotein [Clostridium botulinum B str. Osaka05]|uniref:Lipoprotein n=1 Tax=Clostridium botulinum B str. Osaka05 TaxID=1407017 RepID=A0A0S6U6T9_CLOBO|nr:lipoprotein [Clostridium botulinum B str. Osaka05]
MYALFMGCLCIFSSLFILKMENIKCQNSGKELRSLSKVNNVQKDREYVLSYIDKFFYDNIDNINSDNMDKFIRSLDKNFKVTLSNSSAYFYNGDLIIDYYKNKLFYKQEKYKISTKDSNIAYKREYVSYERKVSN